MGGPWLYPVSKRSGHTFDLDDRPLPFSLRNYEHVIHSGELQQDDRWYITTNWKNVGVGDEVFIYTGDEDAGIIGYAVVQDMQRVAGTWCLRLAFDLSKCRLLVEQPVPATTVRGWVPYPRAPVANLAPFEALLRAALPWSGASVPAGGIG